MYFFEVEEKFARVFRLDTPVRKIIASIDSFIFAEKARSVGLLGSDRRVGIIEKLQCIGLRLSALYCYGKKHCIEESCPVLINRMIRLRREMLRISVTYKVVTSSNRPTIFNLIMIFAIAWNWTDFVIFG